jgi:hypothetical protein
MTSNTKEVASRSGKHFKRRLARSRRRRKPPGSGSVVPQVAAQLQGGGCYQRRPAQIASMAGVGRGRRRQQRAIQTFPVYDPLEMLRTAERNGPGAYLDVEAANLARCRAPPGSRTSLDYRGCSTLGCAHRRVSGEEPTSALVQGFGCRPGRAGSVSQKGRRSETCRGGNRGQPPRYGDLGGQGPC